MRNEGAAGESARSATAGKPSCGYSRRRVTTVTASRVGGSRGGRPRSWARFASAQSLAHRSVAGPKADGSPPTRRTWAFLLLWGGVWALLAARGGGYSWHYFAQGADLLIHVGTPGAGLQLYAAHPDLQIGPLALLAAVPLQAAGPVGGRVLAQVILTLLGPLLLVVLCRARPSAAGQLVTARQLLVTGLLVLPVWAQLATHFTHLDDALALAFTVGAVAAVVHRRGVTAALLLAAAVDAKPWALGFTVLLLALPAGQRRRAALVTGAGVAIAWLPFLLADPRTLAAGGFTIDNADDSALRALGVHTGGTPAWDRPAQLLLGVAVALLCLRRGRWAAVPLAVVATRLLLDPQTYGYYSSGLLVSAAILDLAGARRRWPLWTLAAAAWSVVDTVGAAVLPATQLGHIRAVYCAGVLAVLCLVPADPARRRGPARRTPGPDLPGPRRAAPGPSVPVGVGIGVGEGTAHREAATVGHRPAGATLRCVGTSQRRCPAQPVLGPTATGSGR